MKDNDMKDKVTLYIATHNKTGLKYFGKTTKYFTKKSLQENYHGSGSYWGRHRDKHGDGVTMEIYGIFSLNEVKQVAMDFSKKNNIVESKDWANLMDENGIGGGVNRHWYVNCRGKRELLFYTDQKVKSGEYVSSLIGLLPSKSNNAAVSKANTGMAVYKDSNGTLIRTSTQDERVISGELVGMHKNKRPHNALDIEVYDSNHNLVGFSEGKFESYCSSHGLPYGPLLNSYNNEGAPIFLSKFSHPKPSNIKFKGWYALKSNRIMLHSVSGGFVGNYHDHKVDFAETEFIQNSLMQKIADKTKMTLDEVVENTKRDQYISAEQAVVLGIIDEVVK